MSNLSLASFADELNNLIPSLMKEFAKRQSNELYRGRITMPQFILLSYLEREGLHKMKEIARALGVTTAAATGSVARLVRTGYAVRAHDARDRRIVLVKLTPKGERVFKKIDRERRQMIVSVFSKISSDERQSYLRILRHIVDIMKRSKKRA